MDAVALFRTFLARLLRARRSRAALHVVDQLPLAPGLAVHAIEIDGRRLVFAATPHTIRLLAQYEWPCDGAHQEEPASEPVKLS